MALVKCRECSTDVSDAAFKCPKCGVRLREPRRGFFGQLFKWSFVAFNILMVAWLVAVMGEVNRGVDSMDEVQRAGATIGVSIGAAIIAAIWVIGDIILGLFVLLTRPRSE